MVSENPINQQNKKREEANRFLTLWATGTKSFTIALNTDIVPFVAKSGDYLLMFLGGWSKYAIENKDDYNTVDTHIAAIETVISFYNNNKLLIKKDKEVEKFAKMKEKGTLRK